MAATVSWEKVVDAGFGDANNVVIYLLVSFNGYMYAGTGSSSGGMLYRSSDGVTWTRVLSDLFTSDDYIIFPLLADDNRLYVATANSAQGAKIFSSSDGSSFTQINENGFGSANNNRIWGSAIINGSLYAGSDNTVDGGKVWLYSGSGTGWTQKNTSGFAVAGNNYITGMEAFDGYLYAGVQSSTGAGSLWRYNGTSWGQVGGDGLGETDNEGIYMFLREKFNGYIYVGSFNHVDGASIYRSQDGATWEKFGTTGLGESGNVLVIPRTLSSDKIYFGAENLNGLKVFQSDGSSVEAISDYGFGEPSNIFTDGGIIFNGYLYVSTQNQLYIDSLGKGQVIEPTYRNSYGGQIWRTPIVLPQTGENTALANYVFDLLI